MFKKKKNLRQNVGYFCSHRHYIQNRKLPGRARALGFLRVGFSLRFCSWKRRLFPAEKGSPQVRLGPGTLCCRACTWASLFSSNNTEKLQGVKVTVCVTAGANSGQKIQRPKNPTATSEEQGAKGGLSMPPSPPRSPPHRLPLHSTPPKG